MNDRLILCLTLILGGLLAGCETEYREESHVSLTNFQGDGHTETNANVFEGECSRRFRDGKTMEVFSMGEPPCSVVLCYPTNNLNQISQWQTHSQQAYAWLVRTQLDCQMLWSVKSPAELSFPNSESLHGIIKVGQFDWRHNDRHEIAFDLAGDDGVALKAEINFRTRSKFDPKQLWLCPYIIIVGPFLKE